MKYYMATVLIEVPDEIYNTWDAICDETFGLAHLSMNEHTTITDYYSVDEGTAKEFKHKIFDEGGGI
mgnify:CR=1 FL=1